jgi:hypothetical protein
MCAATNRCVAGTCKACGGMGQVCCNAAGALGDCVAGLTCSGPAGNVMSVCGIGPPADAAAPRDAGGQ